MIMHVTDVRLVELCPRFSVKQSKIYNQQYQKVVRKINIKTFN